MLEPTRLGLVAELHRPHADQVTNEELNILHQYHVVGSTRRNKDSYHKLVTTQITYDVLKLLFILLSDHKVSY